MIDAIGLFPSAMLDAMIAPYLTEAASRDIWLTDDENGPVGVLFCAPERMTEGTWNILLIAVDTAFQRKGRGSAIIGALETRLAERGERVLLVETSGIAEFEAARTFYRHLGYVEEARVRDFYAAGEDKITFWKTLNSES